MGVGTLTVPSGTFHLSGNPLHVQISGATIPAGATNYKVLCKVTSTDSVLIGGPFIDAKVPNAGVALFDVSGYCDQPISKVFEYPLSGGLNPYSNDTLDITFTPGESYIDEDGDLQENWGSASTGNFVVKGGVSFRELGEFHDGSTSFYAEYVTAGKFLTRMPNNQVVHPYQPSKLWLLAAASVTAELNIYAHYDDDDGHVYQNNHGLYDNIMHEVNVLPFHSDSTNMKPVKDNGAKMDYFDVWFTGVSETRRFFVDHTYHEQCNYLFFLNSLGGVDCVWLSGAVQKGFRTESVQAIRPFPSDGTAKYRTLIVAQRTGQRSWKINTGWKSQTEIEAMKDLLLSKQVWLLEDAPTYNSGTLHPVTIETSSAELYDSMEDLFALELDIVEAHNNQYL